MIPAVHPTPPSEHALGGGRRLGRRSADFLQDNRIVLDIRGNNYRLIAQLKDDPLFLVYIRFIGTHAGYDRIDASTI